MAKTLTIASVAKAISLGFQRIQFTPDLLPTDLIGTMIFNPKSGEFAPRKGPIFTNIVLADEINRAPAKVQSALLEAMAEKAGHDWRHNLSLEKPFLVLATQNPLEQEGTILFLKLRWIVLCLKLWWFTPSRAEEMEILNRMATDAQPQIQTVISQEDLMRAKSTVDKIYIDEKIKNYIVEIVMSTREPNEHGLAQLVPLIQVGASPRATISLTRAAKAQAFLRGRGYVTADDVKAIAYHVLRHRLILTYEAEAENMSTDQVVTRNPESR